MQDPTSPWGDETPTPAPEPASPAASTPVPPPGQPGGPAPGATEQVYIPGYDRPEASATAPMPSQAQTADYGAPLAPAGAPPAPADPGAPVPPAGAPAPKRSTGAIVAAGIIGGLLGALLVGGVGFALINSGIGAPRDVEPKVPTATTAVKINPSALVDPAEAVAKKVLPSVVNVSIYQTSQFGGGEQLAGNGSGVVFKNGGYIITNNHVVDQAEKITVRVGAKELPATVVGTDPKTDIAVIKIGQDLPPIEVGDSGSLQVGQTVIAVGSPFGLDKTVTAGIVSALGRSELGDSSQGQVQGSGASPGITAYTNLIQTDAAINPGNSGGALVDAQGRLIGINTLIAAPAAQQSAGIGFAIPESTAVSVAEQIIKSGKVAHPFLGVRSATLSPDMVTQMGKGAPSEGAVVVDVVAGSPADKAGIKRDDIITGLAGQPVKSADDLILAIRAQKVGAPVPVELWRSGKTQSVTVTVGSDQTTTQ